MYGCNNYCSYCIVPYVRGRERSRKPEDIINEVKSVLKEGYKEITLLGQNVDSYGKDLNPKVEFSTLLSMVAELDGKFRIRFVSNHPKDIDENVANTIKKYDKICVFLLKT
jgi:tRNA-2-methylthio-N6-dimethylallyladenosine synthase